jgi:hypothetical protein
MKKISMILMIAIGVSSVAFGQTKMSKDSKVETEVISLEKAGWEAWKNKDGSWFEKNLTSEYLLVNTEGVSSKAEVVKSATSDCIVKGYSIDNFRFVLVTKDSVLLTYSATQDAVCDGKALPAKVNSSAVYVKRGGKWLESLYMETAAAQ